MTFGTPTTDRRLRFAVCEDGNEYISRFERFLGSYFDFLPSQDFGSLLEILARETPISGLLLDLDFRRTTTTRLIRDDGSSVANVSPETLHHLVKNQGIAILSALRKRGWSIPVLLFADIDGTSQNDFITRRFAPVELVASHFGMNELAKKLRELGGC